MEVVVMFWIILLMNHKESIGVKCWVRFLLKFYNFNDWHLLMPVSIKMLTEEKLFLCDF